MKIEALHKFHDADFSKEWVEKFEPTPPRIKLFETILKQIEKVGRKKTSILELGIGPGFLADYLLKELNTVTYEGLDFSESMLKIAAKRTAKHEKIIKFTQADLINEVWTEKLKKSPDVVVSTWALHDLFNKNNIFNVYKSAHKILPKDGVFLNGDFIKPEESNHEYEGGRIRPSEHIKLLQEAGFKSVKCLEEFEKDVENPTTANNYACFKAKK
ncbi:MAG: class I SAM-dependent methyltransferase [Eudoraea sp.]|nr:class I SAM-dependent methyltransferase [Eudoraea sp.]